MQFIDTKDTIRKNMDSQEVEHELIVCDDEKLMKYLVEVTEILLESIWRSSQIIQPGLCPLNEYLSHIIRQSKISLYTLKCAMIYFIRISRQLQDKRWRAKVRLFCGRRMFLGSVIVASKYLYDRTYSNSMWAKILGLDVKEINSIQMDFIETINYDLYISKELDCIWSQMLENFIAYLKAKHEEERKTSSPKNYLIQKKVGVPSPISSPILSDRFNPLPQFDSDHSISDSTHKNFPNSPLSPVATSSDDPLTSSELGRKMNPSSKMTTQKVNDVNRNTFQNTMNGKELKRLEEYRPFVKVLIQVIFMYSSKNSLPVGEKKVIELPKLVTTPDQLFVNSSGHMNPEDRIRNYSHSNLNVCNSYYTLCRLKRQLNANRGAISNKAKLNTLRYFFNKAFPSRHLLMKSDLQQQRQLEQRYRHFQTIRSGDYLGNSTKYNKEVNDDFSGLNINSENFMERMNDSLPSRYGEGNVPFLKNEMTIHDIGTNQDYIAHNEKEITPVTNPSSSPSTSDWDSEVDNYLLMSSDEESNYDESDDNAHHFNGPFFGNLNSEDGWNFESSFPSNMRDLQEETNQTIHNEKLHEDKKLEAPLSRSIPLITPILGYDSYDININSSKTILPCSNVKPLYHPKIVYPYQQKISN